MQSIYPWQQQEWQHLISRKDSGQLSHALLIKGMEGLGKYHFAQRFAENLLCQKNEADACAECRSCQLLESNNHPDLTIIRPEEKSKAIKIDQIRELVADLANTSQQGGYKIVIIDHADLLNIAASNALLKTLEEPASNVVVMLITSHPAALSATIRSRCQAIAIKTPSYSQAQDFLKQHALDVDPKLVLALAENAPLKALELAKEDVLQKRQEFFQYLYELQNKKMSTVQVAQHLLDHELRSLLIMFMHIISDLVKIKLGAPENIINQDQLEELSQLADKANLNNLLSYQTKLLTLSQYTSSKINLNQQLTTETLIITWAQLF
jgi:DNA polymerase III subunit delta'